jgi:UDP-glucose 4-epimerase
MQKPKVLVTGSSGTIGTRLCELLISKGIGVVGVDRKPNKWSPAVQQSTIVGDLLISETFTMIPRDIDFIVHLAANARVYDSVVDPTLAIENINLTYNVLEFCRKIGVKRFIFASSREVYGDQGTEAISEDKATLCGSESPYTASKVSGEALVHAYATCYDIKQVIVRFSNVYGRYDDSNRLVPLFVRKTLAGEELTVFGADKTYDFTYIDDAASAVVSMIESFEKVGGETFNVATGTGVSLLTVANKIQDILGMQKPITVKPNRTGELMHYVADISKARNLLGYKPTIGIDEGLRRAIDWQKEVKC